MSFRTIGTATGGRLRAHPASLDAPFLFSDTLTVMKKILIFSLAYYPKHVGGAEVAIKEITDRISPEEYEFHLVCNRYDSTLAKKEKVGNVYVHRIGLVKPNPSMGELRTFPLHLNKILFQFLAYFKARSLHKQHHFDATWAMMAHACGVPSALFKLFHPKVKYVLTLQEGDPPEHIERKARLVWPLFKRAFTSADTVQVISTFLGQWAKKMGYQNEPVLVPNGVAVAHFAQTIPQEEVERIQRELDKKSGDIFLVTTSRLVHKNGINDVIRALPLLPENIHFVIFGTGPDQEKLEALTRELGVEERVHFKGTVEHDVMPAYLKACDIFVRPSRSEGMGNSFVEAMAAGLPVIATQEGGISDFLFDAVNNPDKPTTGWAVSKNSPQQIAAAVNEIIANPDQVKKVTETAFELVKTKYDWELIVDQMKKRVFEPF